MKKAVIGIGGLLGAIVVAWIGMWLWVLASHDPLNNPAAAWPLWPVACSTRGCVMTVDWLERHQLAVAFAQATNQEAPSSTASLTSAVRQHLVNHAFLKSPVTPNDAKRYREDVLKLGNGEKIREALGVEASVYDRDVVLPLLQQEALRDELKVESTEELYKALSNERLIVLLPFQLKWDKEKGEVITR